jgi:hypothetical protein
MKSDLTSIQSCDHLLCQSRFGVRIPNWQTFEIDRKLDIWQLIWFINEEGGVIRTGFDAPYFI